MSKSHTIPHATVDDKKRLLGIFMGSFGKSYNKMRKEELAMMVINASINFKNMQLQATGVTQIGLAMKRQRDYYHKLCRNKNKYIETCFQDVDDNE